MDQEILEMARAEVSEGIDRIEASLLALENGSADSSHTIDVLFRDAHSIKGTASMVGWAELSSIAHAMEDRLAECRDSGELPAELIDPLLSATDGLRRALEGDTSDAHDAIGALGNGARQPVEPTLARREPEPERAIRVNADKVDRMLDAVGEAVLHHRRLDHQLAEAEPGFVSDVLEEELSMGGRLLDELQDSVIKMRTLPLSTITAPFPRAVRDHAAAHGKQVELRITGAETQLDRLILDGASSSITHILRNAVAHGIETPAERERAGKPPVGTIELRAEQRERMVAIEVSDDGRGVDPGLLARAEQTGSLADVLAAAGFSTASELSDLAGRGVGLDAVKAQVEGLGGTLQISSEPGAGTTVVMLLPLTLALLDVLLCERGGQVFGVALSAVREVVAVSETTSLGGKQSLHLRGTAVRLVDLAALLGAAADPLGARAPALIIGSTGRSIAVACERVLGDQEVVVKSLGPLLAGTPGYLGSAILGDGRVALILDPHHLLKLPSPGPRPGSRSARPADRPAPRLLVVDDQFTVRELQRSILETAGFSVETARDGRDALVRIASEPPIDLVVTDVQMPEMDGFALVRAIRSDQERSSLPVVVVSSKGSEQDRREGLDAGADAYIVKQEFDQQVLLETVSRLVAP